MKMVRAAGMVALGALLLETSAAGASLSTCVEDAEYFCEDVLVQELVCMEFEPGDPSMPAVQECQTVFVSRRRRRQRRAGDPNSGTDPGSGEAPSTGDVNETPINPPRTDGNGGGSNHPPPSDPGDAYEHAMTADDGYIYIVRGVAPAEAEATLEPGDDSGRVTEREHYGIDDADVMPGFQLNGHGDPIDESSLYNIYADMQFYAQQGAAAEEAAERDMNISIRDASTIFPDAQGHIIIYRVPVGTELEPHPESNVSRPEYVVGVPEDAEVWGVIPATPNIGEDGRPNYPSDTDPTQTPKPPAPDSGDGGADGDDITA